MKTFRDLLVWQKSHLLVLSIYKTTRSFPGDERFGLVSQIRRSAASIPTNIVEGSQRRSTKDLLHFLNLAEASLEETKYLLLLSKDLNYIDEKAYLSLIGKCDEVGKMLCGLQRKLDRD